MITSEQKAMILDTIASVYDCIKSTGDEGLPSGYLYAELCGHLDIHNYLRIVKTLKDANMVRECNHKLYAIPLQ